VIHFAPGISATNIQMFEKGFDTLEMFAENGANKNTVVRAFGEVWEQPLSELIKEVDYMAENSKTHSLDNLIEFSKEENTKEPGRVFAEAWKLPITHIKTHITHTFMCLLLLTMIISAVMIT
jgi:hypothetical protein